MVCAKAASARKASTPHWSVSVWAEEYVQNSHSFQVCSGFYFPVLQASHETRDACSLVHVVCFPDPQQYAGAYQSHSSFLIPDRPSVCCLPPKLSQSQASHNIRWPWIPPNIAIILRKACGHGFSLVRQWSCWSSWAALPWWKDHTVQFGQGEGGGHDAQ